MIAPGYDAWVVGSAPVVGYEFDSEVARLCPKPRIVALTGRRWRVAGVQEPVAHTKRDDESGGGGEDADGDDRGRFIDGVGSDPDEQAPGCVPEVAPESVHADGRSSPGRVGAVAYGGHQRGIDKGGSDAHRERGRDPTELRQV